MSNLETMIKEHGLANLESIQPDSVYGCDLHHELYNMDYFVIGYAEAKRLMGERAFDIIGEVQEYEQFNFGEVTTDLSCPEKVINMYSYIKGEEFLQESDTLGDEWNDYLEADKLVTIAQELREAL